MRGDKLQSNMLLFPVFCLVWVSTLATAEVPASKVPAAESDFRNCEDVLVDDVTDMAYADQGQPFTGKVRCFYDDEMKFLKSERVFDAGVAIGSHHCYYRDGPRKYSIIFKDGKRHKLGSEFFSPRVSTRNEGGKGRRYGSIFFIPDEYREYFCVDKILSAISTYACLIWFGFPLSLY